jgi:diaminopimelate epimerase
MRFAKYQGIGNDFVMLADPDDRLKLTPDLVRGLCDRRFGIGADGVIRVAPGTDGADFFMDYVNADGSVGEMCGNGIRCLALFARAEGLTAETDLKVSTRAGLLSLRITPDGWDDGIDSVTVDMGAPIFDPEEIPVEWVGRDALHAKFEVDGGMHEMACLSMGNPHAVLFVDDPADAPVTTLGPAIENLPAFPNKTNVEFVHVNAPDSVEMRVWERGVGETLACGTGAAASAVAARLLQGTNEKIEMKLPGGFLEIEWKGSLTSEQSVWMTGPAARSFEGDIRLREHGLEGQVK